MASKNRAKRPVSSEQPGPARPKLRSRLRARALPAAWKKSLGLGLVSAIGLIAAFPPVGLWVFVLLPVWATLRAAQPQHTSARATAERPAPSGLWFAIGTIPAWAWLTRWAAQGAVAGYPLMVIYLAGFSGMTVWAMSRVRRKLPRLPGVVAVPVVWVGIEALRGMLAFDGFAWFLVEHPLIDAGQFDAGQVDTGSTDAGGGLPLFAWPARWGGVWLVGVLLALAVWLLDQAIQRTQRIRWGLGFIVFIATWAGTGVLLGRHRGNASPSVTVAIIQTDVPQSIKTGWSFDERLDDWLELRDLILAAGLPDENGRTPDFLVIPETMFPGAVLQDDAAAVERRSNVAWILEPDSETGNKRAIRAGTVRDELLEVSARLGDIPIFVGATRYEGFRIDRDGNFMNYGHDARYNSVFVVRGGRVLDTTYDKQHLTPFGEVMPYISRWDWLERAMLGLGAGGMSFDLDAGTRRTVFEIDPASPAEPDAPGVDAASIRLVAPICYEATVASVCRALVFGAEGRRADILVNLTNDGWFYDAAGGREAHLMMARWRCLELATPMVRAANTGVSAVIGADGEIRAMLDANQPGVLLAAIPEAGDATPYSVIRDAIGRICMIGAIFGVALSYIPMSAKAGAAAKDAPDSAEHPR